MSLELKSASKPHVSSLNVFEVVFYLSRPVLNISYYPPPNFRLLPSFSSVLTTLVVCSVLVHSGGVHGGHYYAFIRPTLSNQWYAVSAQIWSCLRYRTNATLFYNHFLLAFGMHNSRCDASLSHKSSLFCSCIWCGTFSFADRVGPFVKFIVNSTNIVKL